MPEFINLTPENLEFEHLSCIIRTRASHPGVEAKRTWLAQRLREGHVFRKLDQKATAMIEYAPLETAWVPAVGENFYYIYCLWTEGEGRGKGYGKTLMEYCLEDARRNGRSGVCMLGANRQKAWLSDQKFAQKYGFSVVDSTDHGYDLLALSFDGTAPAFTDRAKKGEIEEKELTIYYDLQCPHILQRLEWIGAFCGERGLPLTLRQVESLEMAKDLPCVFNNWAVFYKGKFQTVNLLLPQQVEGLLQK